MSFQANEDYCVNCNQVYVKTVHNRLLCDECRSKNLSAHKINTCLNCFKQFIPKRRGGKAYSRGVQDYCSRDCGFRASHKRIHKPKPELNPGDPIPRNISLTKAAGAESFNPLDILNRDGWKCYICGIETPKELRGKFKHNSPEIDHIYPLSAGGKHTRDNVACICRKCNTAKGNQIPANRILTA